ncbi:MAG: flagellin, partial [Selenomonadaceae bacterium]|nr:flagellin [Selenomonadaceae bacterium]
MSSTVIKNNIPAMIVLGTLTKNSGGIDKSLKKASSGEKVTSAEDDASAWSISERMRVKMRSIGQATQNAQNDNSLMQTAEGALNSTLDILRNLKERAVNSANDANTDDDRKILQKEVDGLIDQVDDNALVTFNGKALIDGTHNSQTISLLNSFANESLGNNMDDPLIQWTNKNGDSLEIQSTDKIIISAVWQGKAFVSSEPQEIENKGIVELLQEWESDTGIGDGVLWSTNRNFYGIDGQGREIPTPGGTVGQLTGAATPGAPGGAPGAPTSGGNTVEIISPRVGQTDYNVPPDGTVALDHQFGSFNLSIIDAQGNVRKTVNRYVDNFKEVIRAQNKSDDNALNF